MKPVCEIHCGDMLELLPRWASESLQVDSVICDPPYHLASIAKRFGKEGSAPAKHGRDGAAGRLSRGFMGTEADAGDISFRPETWKACLDMLKPGGRIACFGGTRTFWKTAAAMDVAGFEIEDTIMWVYGQGLVLRRSRLKPCWEPILLGRKKGPVQDLNIDECRTSTDDPLSVHGDKSGYSGPAKGKMQPRGAHVADGQDIGRWPGNLIHDGSVEVVACFPEVPGQIAKALTDNSPKNNKIYSSMKHGTLFPNPRTDSGSAARFFTSCAPDEDERRIIYCGKAPSSERCFNCGICGATAFRSERDAHQHDRIDFAHLKEHATVKPLSLLAHLVKLLCPPDGLVLDPFAGTCSLGVAAVRSGRNAICVEREAAHAATGRLRLSRE
jgi:site-specific DNA-methyltransferase (adenine-specific)